MSDQPFRFLHASDLRIDEPLYGLSRVSELLVDLMIDAPYDAAEQVFDTAVTERVAAVVLSGRVLDLRSPTPRALLFLREQFCRLSEHGISVFWAGGPNDRAEQWPAAVELPDTVHHFGTSLHEEIGVTADDRRYAVLGRSDARHAQIRSSDFEPNSGGLFSIAAVAGQADPQSLATSPIDYWALGGRSRRKTLFHEPHVAHYPGTPQGRNPADVGPHGCTLVDVGSDQRIRSRFIPGDAVRWLNERVTVAGTMASDRIDSLLVERIQELRSQSPEKPLLVTWTLVPDDESLNAHLFRAAGPIAERLNRRFGNASERCWTVSVDTDPGVVIPPQWYDEDTLLGDYLRAIRDLQQDCEEPLLDSVPPFETEDARFQAVARVSDPGDRARVLRQASELGASLLRGASLSEALDRALAGEPTDWE